MNNISYDRWWQLHLRVAKGESLSPKEEAEYDTGLEVLDREEKGLFNASGLSTLRRLRAQVKQSQTTYLQLVEESTQLDQEIILLEKAYQSLTGYELAGGTYVSS
jgi:hypothetical protein